MIRRQDKQRLRVLYGFGCGYCSVSEAEMGSELTIDHFQPRAEGGSDDFDNLVYSCPACNQFKSSAQDADSPPVLHPLREDLTVHFMEQTDGTLFPLTEAGQRHIATLHLNRAPLAGLRRRNKRQQEVILVQQAVESRIESLEAAVRELTSQLTQSTPQTRKPRKS